MFFSAIIYDTVHAAPQSGAWLYFCTMMQSFQICLQPRARSQLPKEESGEPSGREF